MTLPILIGLGLIAFLAFSKRAQPIAQIDPAILKNAAEALSVSPIADQFFTWLTPDGKPQGGNGAAFAAAIETGLAFQDPNRLKPELLKQQADLIRARTNTRYKVIRKDATIIVVDEKQLADRIERADMSLQIPSFWQIPT